MSASVSESGDDLVLSWIEDGVGWVSLNRPEAANAATPALMQRLCAVLEQQIADERVRAIILTSEGRHFLAGGDFDFLEDLAEAGGTGAHETIYRWFQGAARLLFLCRKPTVAAISGAAITVGCELALACDVRIADRTAFFEESWLDLGLIPPLGGAFLLPRLIGLSAAREMILEARRVGAEEAARLGLVNAVVDDRSAARTLARSRALAMADRSPDAFAAAKDLLAAALDSTLGEAWQAGVKAQAGRLASADFRAALTARRRG